MNCKYCKKEIKNKGGLAMHEMGCPLNPHRIIYKSNFIKYNEDVRNGKKIGKNQYILAKEKGEKWEMSKESIEKFKKSMTGKSVSSLTKEKLSLSRSKIIEELGNGGFKNIKWYKIYNIEKEEFIVRGTWELKIANLLNDNNIKWIRKIYLKYNDNEIIRTYTPDFYLPGFNKYIEVKGYFSEKDKRKIKLVLEKNKIDLLIIDKNLIKDLNLIDKITASIPSD
jgi:hypothetical protein